MSAAVTDSIAGIYNSEIRSPANFYNLEYSVFKSSIGYSIECPIHSHHIVIYV
jgi:hypothetical protein